MPTNQKKEWEKEFDERFPQEELVCYVSHDDPEGTTTDVDFEDIKAFIRKTIHSRNESLVALVRKFAESGHECQCGNKIYCGQELLQQALAQEIIRNSEEV